MRAAWLPRWSVDIVFSHCSALRRRRNLRRMRHVRKARCMGSLGRVLPGVDKMK